MRPVVSDAGPLHYLVLIEAIDNLPTLFGHVSIPAVANELSHPATPPAVRAWLETPPFWLERKVAAEGRDVHRSQRGAGERAAIEMAELANARLLLIDDRAADMAARARGLTTTGTIGVLVRAAQLGLVDLASAFSRLRETNFRCRRELLDAILAKHGAEQNAVP